MTYSEVINYLYRLNDFWILARTILFEAGGEVREGQEAVADVILNRRWHPYDWPKSIKGVCLEPQQFSCFNSGVGGLNPHYLRYPWLHDLPGWTVAKDIAVKALSLEIDDHVPGATFYRNPRTATSGWFQRQIESGKFILVRRIGHHDFYRLKSDPERFIWGSGT